MVIAGVVLWPAMATADLTIKWDCYLPNTGLDCVLLESSLTSKIPFLKIVGSPADADVVVTITSRARGERDALQARLRRQAVDGYRTEVHSTDKIPSSIDSTTATVRILTKLERGLDDFMDQKIAAEVKDGKLDIELVDPVALPFTGRPEQSRPEVVRHAERRLVLQRRRGRRHQRVGATAGLAFNYSAPTWRVQQSIERELQPSRASPSPARTRRRASVHGRQRHQRPDAWALTRDNRWSLGLLLSAEKNPQANYTFRANGSVGVEYDLIPRQTVNQKNFGFRCAVGPEFQRYDATNVEGMDQQLVGRQFCDVFLSWHFQPDRRAGPASGRRPSSRTSLPRLLRRALGDLARDRQPRHVARGSTSSRSTRPSTRRSPRRPSTADPRQEVEASMLAAVQQGYTAPFGIQAGLSIKYVFGNGSLGLEDQRWKGTSNLR